MRLRLFGAILVDGARGFWRGRSLSMTAVLVIASTFTVTSLAFLAAENLAAAVARWSRPDSLRIYFEEETPPAATSGLAFHLRDRPEVVDAVRVDPESARRRFQEQFPEMLDLVDLVGENPFPTHVEVTLVPDLTAAERTTITGELKRLPHVMTVLGDDLWWEQLMRWSAGVRRAGEAAGLLFALAAALVIAGVIRLSLAGRQREIEVMSVVGAPRAFMAGPFLVEGALEGVAGALLALIVAWGVFRAAAVLAPAYPLLGFLSLAPLPARVAGLLLGAAAVCGIGGALLAVRRMVRPRWRPPGG
ncbi:MAG: cell division protein FtsX [Acidobacteriota bacterium]